MDSLPRPRLEGPLLERLEEFARIKLTPERRAIAGPTFDAVLQGIDALDALDLGDAPPETGFDPRWER